MKVLKWLLFVLYAIALFYIVFFARRRQLIIWHDDLVNLIPLEKTIESYLSPATGRWNFFVNLLGNIGLFVPLPFFIAGLFRITNKWIVIAIGMLISVSIEGVQYGWRIGVPDIDDVLLNVLGTVVGVLVWNSISSRSYAGSFLSKLS